MSYRIAVTGFDGFLGYHLRLFLKKNCRYDNVVPIGRDDFRSVDVLSEKLARCNIVVHFAGMNRGDENEVYKTNVDLARRLRDALNRIDHRPHVLFASSTHESRPTAFGKSKVEARQLLAQWCREHGAQFSGLIIPNVFGPFAKPFYNSVVATFCHQLTHGESPQIDNDSELPLIYVENLMHGIEDLFHKEQSAEAIWVQPEATATVSRLHAILSGFRNAYFVNGILPKWCDSFEQRLLTTLLAYAEHDQLRRFPQLREDERGALAEVIKSESGGQVFYSVTKPGVTRGNHYHTRKLERFCVIGGKARIRLRKIFSDAVTEFTVDGNKPAYVDMPVYHTHNITNIGEGSLLTVFWTNELFNPDDPDTYGEEV